MKYKIIGLDLDGTLLNSKKQITNETNEYISRIIKQGGYPVISTGRTFAAAKHYYQQLNLATPFIGCNGAFIYCPVNQKFIDSNTLSKSIIGELIEFLLDQNTYFHFYSLDTIYTHEVKYLTKEWKIENEKNDYTIKIEQIDGNFEELLNQNIDVFKMLVIEPDETKRLLILEFLNNYEEIETVSSFSGAIDIMAKSITKGNALKKVANYYNLTRESVIAIGDNDNDVSMLQYASIGIAMENASLKAKEVSTFITTSNDEDGVINGLKKFL